MDPCSTALTSPAGVAALVAAALWAPINGVRTWPAPSRGRYASTIGVTLAVAACVFRLVSRLTAPTQG